MKIDGYELNYSEEELDVMLNQQTRPVELISKDFEGYKNLSENDKKAIEHLVNAANIINDVALEQDNPLNLKIKEGLERASLRSSHAEKALDLFHCINGVIGFNGIDREPVRIVKEAALLPGRNFYPDDLSVEEFHRILLTMGERGEIDEIRKILSSRTMVRRAGDVLKAIDYTEYFSEAFSEIANELEAAAYYCTESEFKEYLGWQAQALLQNNPDMDMLADKHWAKLQDTCLEFTISRENYEDEITGTVFDNPEIIKLLGKYNIKVVAKDTLGCRVGIVNREETEKILLSKKMLPELAKWMPYNNYYTQSSVAEEDLKQSMVDVDLIALTGDYAMCRGGITAAQNLPNNDKIAVQTGGGRRNVYHRQVRFSRDEERDKKLLEQLVDPALHPYVDKSKVIVFVFVHENGHSLGPGSDYQNSLGMYKHIIEEHKANVVSIASIAEAAKKRADFDRETLRKIYASWIVGNLFLRAKPMLSQPHRVADLIEFNYLLESKALWFDDRKKLHIDFDIINMCMYKLLEKTIEVQLSKSVEAASEFINRWATWGEWSRHIAEIQKSLGVKPYIKIISHF